MADRRRTVDERISLVRDLLVERRGQAALFRWRRNVAWLTGGGSCHVVTSTDEAAAWFLVTPTEALVLTTVIEARRIKEEEVAELDLDVVGLPWHEPLALEEVVASRVGRPPHPGETLSILSDQDLEDALAWRRGQLAAFEIEELRQLGAKTAEAMTATFRAIRPGVTEQEAAALLAHALGRVGIRTPVLLAAADDRFRRYRHPLPGPAVIRRSLILVAVAEHRGLHVAMTRTGAWGGQPDEEQLRRQRAVDEIEAELRRLSRPGRRLREIFADAVSLYRRWGFPDEWKDHHQGGVIGYQPRELLATPQAEATLAQGMAVAWNPSVAGAKAEDTAIVGPDGALDIVTRDPAWPMAPHGAPAIWPGDG
jgi:Xaa-Pro dipeptidase